MRALCCGLALLLAGGCASTSGRPSHTMPKVILGVLLVGGAALAIGAAAKGQSIEDKLGTDYAGRDIGGREFASRDSEGQRWNRIARASTFVSGLALLGLGVIWEMSAGDRAQYEAPPRPAPGSIFPAPAAAPTDK
jgi:hypothetical protein